MPNTKLLVEPYKVFISSPNGNGSSIRFESSRLIKSDLGINSIVEVSYVVVVVAAAACSRHLRLNAITLFEIIELVRRRFQLLKEENYTYRVYLENKLDLVSKSLIEIIIEPKKLSALGSPIDFLRIY